MDRTRPIIVTPEEFPEHYKTISKAEWDQLFSLFDNFDTKKKYGSVVLSEEQSDDVMSFPYISPDEVVTNFFDLAYALGLVLNFNWGGWTEGEALLNAEVKNFSELNIIDLCKLITTILRADRYFDGYIVSCFEDGTIPGIVRELKIKVEAELFSI